jgi:NADPH-dependent 7-cyano-7-deazaguanine reductase QueF
LDDLVAALDPHYCEVIGAFAVRGGIALTVTAEHHKGENGSQPAHEREQQETAGGI